MDKTKTGEEPAEKDACDQTIQSIKAEVMPAVNEVSKLMIEGEEPVEKDACNQTIQSIKGEAMPDVTEVPKLTIEDIQSWWEIPAIAQYVSLFRFAFSLPEIEIEELENELLEDETKVNSTWLTNLVLPLLRGILPGRGINSENWEIHLYKLIGRKWVKEEGKTNPFLEVPSFKKLEIRTKVELIYSLCLYRLDKNDTIEAMKSMDAEALRVQSLGSDDLGNMYWYFYGTRLYKEEPFKLEKKNSWEEEWQKQKDQSFGKRGRGRPRKVKKAKSTEESNDLGDSKSNNGYMNLDGKSRWSVVCNTIEEWVDFAERFKNSKSKNEISLFQIIQENFLPVLNDIYQEKERKLQQKIRDLIPNRVITRRETRSRHRRESVQTSEQNGYLSEDAHKLHLVRDRARRLEERNKRASSSFTPKNHRIKRQRFGDQYESNTSMDSDSHVPDIGEYRRAFIPANDSSDNMDLQSKLERLISEVKLHKDAWPFLHPVVEKYAPGYYEIITEPMDLSTIENKLWDGQYEMVAQLDEDFSKLVSNCQLYNGDHSDLYTMAETIWRTFRRGLNKILGSHSKTECLESRKNYENCSLQTKTSSRASAPKKKKSSGMQALEILAQASEMALKNSDSNDVSNNLPSKEDNSSFSSLKIQHIHSHPPALIEKFSSDSSSHESRDSDASSNVSYISQEQYTSPNRDETNNFTKNNIDDNTTNFDRNITKEFNILSENEDDEVSENELSKNESNSSYDASEPNDSKLDSNNEVMDNGLSNILDECGNDLISRLIREPLYATEVQIPQNKDLDQPQVTQTSNSDFAPNRLQKKSPPSCSPDFGKQSVINTGVPLLQEQLHIQSEMCSSSEITTVDASVLGISANSKFRKHNSNINPVVPSEISRNMYTSKTQNNEYQQPVPHVTVPSAASQPNRSKIRYSPTFVLQHNQEQSYSGLNEYNPNQQVSAVSNSPEFRPMNTQFTNTLAAATTTTAYAPQMVQTAVTNSTPQAHLQLPVTYSKTFPNQQNVIRKSPPANQLPAMKVNLPPSTGQILVVPGNSATAGMTFHLFAQPNAENEKPIQAQFQMQPQPTHASENQELEKSSRFMEFSDRQISVSDEACSKRSSPVRENNRPMQIQPVPSKNSAQSYSATNLKTHKQRTSPNSLKRVLPAPNSNFVPVSNASIGNVQLASNPSVVSTSLNLPGQNVSFISNPSGMYLNSSGENSTVYQTLGPKNVPVVLSGYNITSNNGFQPNMVPTTQGNTFLQNSPQVKQLYLQNPQQFQINSMQNGPRQYIMMQPPNDGSNRIFTKVQNAPMQHSERQFRQSFQKTVPDLTANPQQSFTTSGTNNMNPSQGYTQIMANQGPQYLNIPSYVIANQTQQNSVNQPVMNLQPYQMPNQRQLSLDCSGNG